VSPVFGSAAVVAAQSLVLAGLLFQRRRRQQAEQSLKESEDRMTFAAASASIGLWQFNLATGQLWSTEHCQVIFGLPAGVPLTRQTFLGAIHPDDRSIAAAALQGALKGGRSAIADIRVVSTPDEVRWVRIRARSDVYGQNTAGQLSGMFADVTDQKAAESDLELQRQEVAHLMRVTALGELSGAIAHEVNQPLTAILSNAQAALYLLKPESPNFTEIRGALEDIVHEDNRASEVIQRLRGLLKKGESKFDLIDLNELVESTTGSTEPHY
jgi:C4-dicarboxylate-specific signal transduction histidine kinase